MKQSSGHMPQRLIPVDVFINAVLQRRFRNSYLTCPSQLFDTVRRLKIQYRTGEDRPDDGMIGPNVQIANMTREPIPMHTLTIRYWFTRESNQRLFFYCDYADAGCENVWGRAVTMDSSRPGPHHRRRLDQDRALREWQAGVGYGTVIRYSV